MLVYCDNCNRHYFYYKKPLNNHLCNTCSINKIGLPKETTKTIDQARNKIIMCNKNLNRKRSYQELKRTDSNEDYLGSTSTTNPSNSTDENEDAKIQYRINVLNREVSDLYQQIKIKKEEIEELRIKKAVKKAKLETEQRIRRESNKWLPTLDKITDVQKEIINNLSSDSDDDEIDDLLLNTTAEQLFDKICNENLHKNNNKN